MTRAELAAVRRVVAEEVQAAVDKLQPRGLTVPEVADRLGISDTTVRELIKEGVLTTLDLGDRRRTIVPSPAVDAYLMRCSTPAGPVVVPDAA